MALGAFGAHLLEARTGPEAMATWRTASLYHLVHSTVLAALALVPEGGRRWVPAGLLLGGVALFSGSLYLLVLTGERRMAWVTPVGGLLLLAGWAALPLALPRRDR